MQFSHFAVILFIAFIVHIQAETNARTLEGAIGKGNSNKIQKTLHLNDGIYVSSGIDVSRNRISLIGSKNTEIEQDGVAISRAIFFGEESKISLQNLRFRSLGNLVAIIERQSMMIFTDNILVGSTIKNCFEVEGGELVINNLKLDFENAFERRISNLITFSELGGYIHVEKTQLDDIIIEGGRALLGNEYTNGISLVNCKFNKLRLDRSCNSNVEGSNVGQADIVIKDSTFIDVENALVGGIVSGLNQNGKLLVVGSSFTNCHNTKIQQISLSNKHGTQTNITSGDATFKDDHFDNCDSEYGGGFSFASDGTLLVKDCNFRHCNSLLGKGGALYVQGSGEHTIKDCQFSSCIAQSDTISEGGSVYIAGGTNYVKDVSFKQSTALITNIPHQDGHEIDQSDSSDDTFTDQSQSFGGAIMIIDWQDQSFIKDTSFKDCVAGTGGAVYINSVDKLISIQDVTFSQNIASVGGGGALFAIDTTMVKLHNCKFKQNQALLGFLGNDLHFEQVGTTDNHTSINQFQYNIIDGCSSSSIEPRVCFSGEYGCQLGWIPDSYGNMPAWSIVVIVLASCIFCAVIVGLCLFCCYKLLKQCIKAGKEQYQQGNQENDSGRGQMYRSVEEGSNGSSRKQYDNHQMQQNQYNKQQGNFVQNPIPNQNGLVVVVPERLYTQQNSNFPTYPYQMQGPPQQLPQNLPPLNLQAQQNPVYGFHPPITQQQMSFGKDGLAQ